MTEAPLGGAWPLTDVITRLRRILRASIRSEFPWESLPMAQVEIMQRLASFPGLRVRELAQHHRLATNTVSNLIQQMVVAGLVTRDVDPLDRRAVTIHLTTQGERSLSDWLVAHEARLNAALAKLPEDDQNAIAAAVSPLSRLVAQLEMIDATLSRDDSTAQPKSSGPAGP